MLYRERWRSRRSLVPEELRAIPKAIGVLLGRGSVTLGRTLGRAAAARAIKINNEPLPRSRPWWKLRNAPFASADPTWWLEDLEKELAESREETS